MSKASSKDSSRVDSSDILEEESSEEERLDVEGPTVYSNIPSERIAARRIRIQRRQDAIKKQQELAGQVQEEEKEQSAVDYQIYESRQNLDKLILEGQELVTNIRVAADLKEQQRRICEEEKLVERKVLLQEEAEKSAKAYQEITSKWLAQMEPHLPLEMKKRLEEQTKMCEDLLGDKDKLIAEMDDMLNLSQDNFNKNIEMQKEEINLVIERIEDHLVTMRKGFREELDVIERYAMADRKTVKTNNKKKLDVAFKKLDDLETHYVNKKIRLTNFRNQVLHNIFVDDAENFRALKMNLEGDYMTLERQLFHMQAICMQNSEKLDYNYRILKKRDEENTIMRSHQKRRLNKLHDIVHIQQLKMQKMEKQSRVDGNKEIEEICRLHHNIQQIKRKAKNFKMLIRTKFLEMWEMLGGMAMDLLHRVLDIEKVIFEQQLGLEWMPPDLINLQVPIKDEKVPSMTKSPKEKKETVDVYRKPLLKHILDLLCHQSGFLMEDRLDELFKNVERDYTDLVKVEATFSALGIQYTEDIHVLAKYFMRYTERPHGYTEYGKMICGLCSCPLSECACPTVDLTPTSIEELKDLYINPNYVLSAIQEFLTDYYKADSEESSHLSSHFTGPEEKLEEDYFHPSMVEDYFVKFYDYYSESKEKLWEGLKKGIENYTSVLSERVDLLCQCGEIKRQNFELQRLLKHYISSEVNQTLKIPPTATMHQFFRSSKP